MFRVVGSKNVRLFDSVGVHGKVYWYPDVAFFIRILYNTEMWLLSKIFGDEERSDSMDGVWRVYYRVDDYEGPGWWVGSSTETLGPYSSRSEAIEIAQDKAQPDGQVEIRDTNEDAKEIREAYR